MIAPITLQQQQTIKNNTHEIKQYRISKKRFK